MIGTILFILIGLPLLCIALAVRSLIKREWSGLRKALYFPIVGEPRLHHAAQRQRMLQRLNAIEVKLTTEDERVVHGVWIDAAPQLSDGTVVTPPVALLLHANAMVLDDMVDWAQFYLSAGASVFLVTFWGFPDPNDDVYDDVMPSMGQQELGVDSLLLGASTEVRCPTESSMCLDAEAALRHIQQVHDVPLERTLVHGLSIGGGIALSLGVQHPGLKVTFDQGFASLFEVSVHVGAGLFDQLVVPRVHRRIRGGVKLLKPMLLRAAAWVLVRMLFKVQPAEGTGHLIAPDRMDNLRKAAKLKGDLFAIFSEHDEMMPHSISSR